MKYRDNSSCRFCIRVSVSSVVKLSGSGFKGKSAVWSVKHIRMGGRN